MELTARYWPQDGGFAPRTEEFPDITARGDTLDEARRNLRATIRQTIEERRKRDAEELSGMDYVEEKLIVTSSPETGLRISFLGT
ncbi:MAG TPA: type II toxin-antitoxin system HicB family antitoxin [Longimicrobium sp.]|jgi:predicted RNase H-like HicB family nuclease|nr:type II toxin-antitoxin system HicB family antitoxin [Longimicrobium sp.]